MLPKSLFGGHWGPFWAHPAPRSPKLAKKGAFRQPKGAKGDPQINDKKHSLESGPAKVDEQVLTRYLQNLKK